MSFFAPLTYSKLKVSFLYLIPQYNISNNN